MIDPSIALQVRVPQPISPVESYGRTLSLKNLVQQGQMGELQMQKAHLEAADQQKARQAYMESGGDLDKFQKRAAELGVGPNTLTAIQKHVLDTKKTVAEIADMELAGKKYQNEQMLGLTTAALALPDDEYAQQWPALRAQALRINPGLQLPDQPVPKANLEAFRLGFLTQDQLFKQEAEKRAVNTDQRAAAEEGRKVQLFPSQLAESQAKSAAEVRTNAAAQLGAAQSADTYRQVWENLPAGVARNFPAPEQWDAKTTPAAVRQAGMKSAEQVTADQAAQRIAGEAAGRAETRRHNAETERHGRASEIELSPALAAAGAGAPGGSGEAALAKYPQVVQSLARQLVEYKIPLPSGMALSRPNSPWNLAIQAAGELDPDFDASVYNTRLATRKDFTSGKSAQNVTRLNTVISHLDSLKKAADKLENRSVGRWNAAVNRVYTEAGDPRVKNFDLAANAVESELANVFKGTGATDQEIRVWRANLDSAQSPKQLTGVIDSAIDLLASRMAALQDQYEKGLGKPKSFRFLNDRSRKILEKLGKDPDTLDPVGAAQPKAGSVPAATNGPRATHRYNPATGQIEAIQ